MKPLLRKKRGINSFTQRCFAVASACINQMTEMGAGKPIHESLEDFDKEQLLDEFEELIQMRAEIEGETERERDSFEGYDRDEFLAAIDKQLLSVSEKLQAVHGTQSFSRPGTSGDNSVMESFFATLKKEELYRMNYRSFKDFETSLEKYILFYNEQRPYGAVNYKTPQEAEFYYWLSNPGS